MLTNLLVKRRRFFKYVGLGTAGLLCSTHRGVVAATSDLAIAPTHNSALKTFQFSHTSLDTRGLAKSVNTYTAKYFSEPLQLSSSLEMVAIAPNQFIMGAAASESQAKQQESPQHRVNIDAFFMSKYPITQAQWAAVAALPKVHRELNPMPSHFPESVGRNQAGFHPVESVSWLDAVEFCDRLSQYTGKTYRLPSEAEWEYGCRAGSQTPFSTGATITSERANYVGRYTYKSEAGGEYRHSTAPVGSFAPNAFGLYDMHGNVWEWCADRWHTSYHGAPVNGKAWLSGQSSQRTIRGGSWSDQPATLRSASRSGYVETGLNRTIGFRVVTT